MSNDPARILLIEDNKVQARAIQTCLEKDHDVVSASTAEDARAHLNTTTFDLVVVDWGLPGESGLSLVRALREDARLPDLPILMQTGEDRSEHVRDAVKAGVDDYLVKPVYCETLREKVAALLTDSKSS